MDIGKNIKKLRIDKKMNQGELVKLSGLSQRALSGIENGSVSPRAVTLEKIARALDVPIADLMA